MPEKTGVPTSVPTTLKFRIFIEGSIESVFREITRTDAPIKCFFNSQMHVRALAPGSMLAMRTPDGRYTGVVGEILEYDPPRRFVHTFRFTAYDDAPCVVAYDLVPKDNGVEFTLTVENVTPGTKSAKQMTQGGAMIVRTLKRVIETGRPSAGTRALFVLFKVLQPISPRRCRSDLWPLDGSRAG